MKVVMLEDDLEQANLIRSWLEVAGYEVSHCVSGDDFLSALQQEPFDLALVDWELPDQSGVEVVTRLRSIDQNSIPVIFATQRDSEEDVVKALNSGADDYLVKPLRQKELLARLDAIKRRIGHDWCGAQKITLGNISLDLPSRSVQVDGEEVKVTQKDFDVAVCLIKNLGKVLSREYLLKTVWGVNAKLNTRTVDMHVSRVRRSLRLNPDMGYCIRTIYQHGYRLEKVGTH